MEALAHPPSTPHSDDTFYQVDVNSLRVGRYNRALSDDHVEALIRAYEQRPWMIPPIECNMREDGSMVVVNGQHRAEAARRMHLTCIQAVVHFGWTEEEEAASFRDSAKGKRVDGLSLWHAARVAGQQDVRTIEAILESYGLHVPRAHWEQVKPGTITCPQTLLKIAYGNLSGGRNVRSAFRPARLDNTLSFVTTTWPSDQRHLEARILTAVAAWLVKYQDNPTFNLKEAQRKLSAFDCTDIIRRMQLLIHSEGVTTQVAGTRVLTGLYDRSRRVGRLQPLEEEERDK